MTIARRQLIDVSVTRWYHCISRCVRGALVLDGGSFNRKEWLETRNEELAQVSC
jgi:putative transposase